MSDAHPLFTCNFRYLFKEAREIISYTVEVNGFIIFCYFEDLHSVTCMQLRSIEIVNTFHTMIVDLSNYYPGSHLR